MKTASCKAKGRRLAAELKELLLRYAPDLESGDILVTPSGVKGPDLCLSPRAKLKFPLAIECKNQESIAIWEALKQAESHQKTDKEVSVLFFKRNKSKIYVALDAEEFVKWIS